MTLLELCPRVMPTIKSFIPEWANPVCGRMYRGMLRILIYLETLKVNRVLKSASDMPSWLDLDTLESLQLKYPPQSVWSYDIQAREQRGKRWAEELLRVSRKETKKINDFLELGCFDGMVGYSLQHLGKRVTCVDFKTDGFDGRAVRNGVKLLQMDAAKLRFNDSSFDFVFSYNSFEHFSDPALVLKEATRVLKPGGYIYLDFAPLYMSPWGLHLYNKINIPYCQFLFPENLVRDFAEKSGLGTIDCGGNNCWSIEEYRELWRRYSNRLKKIIYIEGYDTSHVDLIAKYPSCFRSKTKYFDNLIINRIIVLFKKIR